ncbi:MAG: (4Fe-4S)-binding protein [Bacteroidetes bacterium]|nr:(4Fe-4S)-binding protein [Bacteroidota bacterium]
MTEITKKYSNDEITIVWKPSVCIHSTLCWKGEKGLRQVFNPAEKPWIKPQGATTPEIIERVHNCPSGAISFYYNNEENKTVETHAESIVEVSPNGPLLVYGNISVKHIDGETVQKNKVTAFCRCGASSNKPYCDGTHTKNGFVG